MNDPRRPHPVGRASADGPANRYLSIRCESDWTDAGGDDGDTLGERVKVDTEFYVDESRSLIRENESPDIPFRFSINPYRGCEHGCAYCYARPSHETFGWNAGIDFETKILVKRDAPSLLRTELQRPKWRGDPILMSGNTDCYQPAERYFRITRQCMEIMVGARQAFYVITKNALVLRDLDLLREAALRNTVVVHISITTLDAKLCRAMEPRTSTPSARLKAVEQLTTAGVPVAVMVAPIIPGLTDHEIPKILRATRDAGALSATGTILRLASSVLPVFQAWLETHVPAVRERVESRIRECRGGELNDAKFFQRMKGTGPYAENIWTMFRTFRDQLGFQATPKLDTTHFRPPVNAQGQQLLF